MKRAVVFAHYDKDNLVDDYVVYYLQALRKVCDTLVFVSCGELSQEQKAKTNADIIIAEPHKEYDFGSYKRGFFALNPDDYDEIIFANDSCYGPLFDLKGVFDKIEKSDCDFWGITRNKWVNSSVRPHVQSYFVVFRKEVFGALIEFVRQVKEEANKLVVIEKYEIGLSEYLHAQGFKSDSAVESYRNSFNVTILKWREIVLRGESPFIKCSVLRGLNNALTDTRGWEKAILQGYPTELIIKNLERTFPKYAQNRKTSAFVLGIYYNIIGILPPRAVWLYMRGYNFLRKRLCAPKPLP